MCILYVVSPIFNFMLTILFLFFGFLYLNLLIGQVKSIGFYYIYNPNTSYISFDGELSHHLAKLKKKAQNKKSRTKLTKIWLPKKEPENSLNFYFISFLIWKNKIEEFDNDKK